MTAYATVLDLCPGFGWQGGPEFNTRVVTLRNGHERRNANWDQIRHHYILPFQNISDDAYKLYLKSVFLSMRGQTHSFLVKDHSDFEATLEALGNAPSGSTPVQLKKVSTFGAATYDRLITKPKAASVTLYQNGVEKAGTYSSTTGLFTPTTGWTAGQPLTWTGEFYVPVRFASDLLQMSIDNKISAGYAMNGSIELVEVFGE